MKFKIEYVISKKLKGKIKLEDKVVEGNDLDALLEQIFKEHTDTYVMMKQKNFELVSPDVCLTGHIIERRG